MKVLHLETGMYLYGGAQQVLYLLEGLKRKGVENVLVCAEGSRIERAATDKIGLVHSLPMRGDLDLAFLRRFTKLVREVGPELVHLHSRRGADTLGALAARRAGARVVLSRRVDNPESRLAAALKYRLCDKVIAISECIRHSLIRAGVAEQQVVCVPSAPDRRLFRPQGDEAFFLREFRLRPGQKTVAIIAQLIERKGHRYLLDAIPAMLERVADLRVLVFGQGPLEAWLFEQIKERRLRGCVTVDGFRDDLHRYLACVDVVVHPATAEGLGVALLQAASCAVPVVASRVGGIPEVVRDGVNGLLVEPRDPAALAEAVCRLLENQSFARELGRRGRELVDAEFSISNMVAGNLRVYEEVLGRRLEPPQLVEPEDGQ